MWRERLDPANTAGDDEGMAETSNCPHARRQLIAKDEHEEYVECLDCGAILEAGELPEPAVNFPESLSDA